MRNRARPPPAFIRRIRRGTEGEAFYIAPAIPVRFHVEQNPVSKGKTNAFLYTRRLKSQALPLLAAMAARSAAGSTDVLCERS